MSSPPTTAISRFLNDVREKQQVVIVTGECEISEYYFLSLLNTHAYSGLHAETQIL